MAQIPLATKAGLEEVEELAESKVASVVAGDNVTIDDSDPRNPVINASGGGGGGEVPASRTIGAGTGLTGGGDLSANRTIALSAGSIEALAAAGTAVQPDALAAVATSGDYESLTNLPSLGSAAGAATSDFDPAGAAASAVSTANAYTDEAFGGLAAVASSGDYGDLDNRPALADVATSGAYSDLDGTPTLGSAAAAATTDFATASQGALAASAVQPGALATVATSGDYEDLDNLPAPAIVAFDAGGNASAARPSVPTSTIVLWIDVPSEPTNLGPFDMWEETP